MARGASWLGYLPQYEWEASAVAMAACFVGLGFVLLLTGRAPGGEWLSARTIRLAGGFQILLGVAVGLTGFFTNAEPPGSFGPHGHWGGTADHVWLGIWLAVLARIMASILRKYRR